MVRDYRYKLKTQDTKFKRSSQLEMNNKTSIKSSKILWIFLVVLAILISGFVVLHFINTDKKLLEVRLKTLAIEPTQNLETTQDLEKNDKKLDTKIENKEHLKIDYSFYNGLSETEVVVEAEPISVKLIAPYYIQVGTFFSNKSVRKEQKRLKYLGFKFNVSVLKGRTKTFYRLRLGPFKNRLVMNKVRSTLRDVGVDALVVKGRKRSKN